MENAIIRAYLDSFQALKERFNQSYDSLSNILGQLICLPDLVNDLYVLEKSRAYVIDSPYLDTAEKTLDAVLKRIIGGDDYCAEDGGEISALFAPLEGKTGVLLGAVSEGAWQNALRRKRTRMRNCSQWTGYYPEASPLPLRGSRTAAR